jgi:glutamine synthetase
MTTELIEQTLLATNNGHLSEVGDLQARLAQQGVRYAIGAYVDIHGVPKAKCVPLPHLGDMMRGSELFTGYALDGLGQQPNDDEISAVPDPRSVTILPWKKDVVWFAADNHFHGAPYPLSTRVVLQNQIKRAAALGYSFNLGIEAEIYVLGQDANGKLYVPNADDNLAKPCYDIKRFFDAWPFLDKMVTYMQELGWDVYSFDHEDGQSQFEFDFNYSDALTMSDRYTFFRFMAKTVAAELGLVATFMPKPFADQTGNGAHFNMSLADLETGKNLFKTEDDPRGCGLSEVGYHFIGGLMAHGRGIMAALAPTVNSYKRLIRRGAMGYYSWAPVFNTYGSNNRSNNFRIPMGGGRVECRGADSTVNPYLGAALLLAAGLDGVERKLDPGAPRHENMYEYTDIELAERGIEKLPQTLDEAIGAFAADPWIRETLGGALTDEFIRYKQEEWQSYHNTISAWEVERYARLF